MLHQIVYLNHEYFHFLFTALNSTSSAKNSTPKMITANKTSGSADTTLQTRGIVLNNLDVV